MHNPEVKHDSGSNRYEVPSEKAPAILEQIELYLKESMTGLDTSGYIVIDKDGSLDARTMPPEGKNDYSLESLMDSSINIYINKRDFLQGQTGFGAPPYATIHVTADKMIVTTNKCYQWSSELYALADILEPYLPEKKPLRTAKNLK